MLLCPLARDYFFIFFYYGARGGAGVKDTECQESGMGREILTHSVCIRAWKMYPLGVMFGLGFDTSSEVALLGIASLQGTRGTSIWVILIFPLLFTGKQPLAPTSSSFPFLLSLTNIIQTQRECASSIRSTAP